MRISEEIILTRLEINAKDDLINALFSLFTQQITAEIIFMLVIVSFIYNSNLHYMLCLHAIIKYEKILYYVQIDNLYSIII